MEGDQIPLPPVELRTATELCMGRVLIRPTVREVIGPAGRETVEPLVMKVLVALVQAGGEPVTRDELTRRCWKGRVVGEDSINRVMHQIRRLASRVADGSFVVRTVTGLGYQLIVEVPEFGVGQRSQIILPSIAVLPFANLGSDPDSEYFVEGMVEEIVTALTRIRSLFVIASSSTLSLKGQRVTVHEAARRLGVRYVVEGSVRRSGARIRINVKLADTHRAAQIWAEHFEDTLEDVFALQDRVALSVAGAIEPSLQTAEIRRVARGPLASLDAYDLYLRGAQLRATLNKAHVLQAITLLQRATSLAPDFAPALAQLAGCHSQVVANRWADDQGAHRRAGLEFAERAINAAGDDAAVLVQTANALMELDESIDRATALIERAIALNPGSAFAWLISGILGLIEGACSTAVAHFERAAQLDPISRYNDVARAHIGIGRGLLGDYREGVRLLRGTTHRSARIYMSLIAFYGHLDMAKEARQSLEDYAASTSTPIAAMVTHATHDAVVRAVLLDGIARATRR